MPWATYGTRTARSSPARATHRECSSTPSATSPRVARRSPTGGARGARERRITPFGTLFDGDITFAVSPGSAPTASPLQVEALAAEAVPEALERAVRLAKGTPAVPGLADRRP